MELKDGFHYVVHRHGSPRAIRVLRVKDNKIIAGEHSFDLDFFFTVNKYIGVCEYDKLPSAFGITKGGDRIINGNGVVFIVSYHTGDDNFIGFIQDGPIESEGCKLLTDDLKTGGWKLAVDDGKVFGDGKFVTAKEKSDGLTTETV